MAHLYTNEELVKAMDAAPMAVQQAIESKKTLQAIREIGATYKLHIDQLGRVAELNTQMLLGIVRPAEVLGISQLRYLLLVLVHVVCPSLEYNSLGICYNDVPRPGFQKKLDNTGASCAAICSACATVRPATACAYAGPTTEATDGTAPAGASAAVCAPGTPAAADAPSAFAVFHYTPSGSARRRAQATNAISAMARGSTLAPKDGAAGGLRTAFY